MKDRLFEALKAGTADYIEIRIETEESSSLTYRGTEIDDASSASWQGGIVRACTNGGWGTVVFDSVHDLSHQVQRACEAAALVGKETTELADAPVVDNEASASLVRDFRGVGLDEKLRLVTGYNTILLNADPAIQTTNTSYRDIFRTVYFANSRGSYFMEERPRVMCVFSAIARDGSLVQRAFDSVASTTDYNDMVGLEARVEDVGKRAAALLKAPKPEGGPHSVVLNPRMAGVFIHEAFGHLSEADFLYENPKMRELMHLGREVGIKGLHVIDDGSIGPYNGTLAYDDEGTPTGQTYLIKNGVLSGHLHSLETAGKMGARPTGNARAQGRNNPPIVRMTNTYIDNGDLPIDELFAGVERGIYACDMFGGQTMLEMFTFSAAHGYRIENGQKGELVRDVVLTGNVFQTLNSIDGIGNDLRLYAGAGACGKGGQSVPVGLGSPHIRIRDVVIGGK